MNILQKFTDNSQHRRFHKSRLTTAILSSIVLTACGGGGGGGGGTTPTTGTPTTTDSPPSVSLDERIVVSAGEAVSLTATATDSDGDTISFSWEQQSGDAVANTDGFDSSTASFSAPDEVSSIIFDVTATANGQSDQASILVIVVEDVESAIFVDAEFSGTSDGSIDAPYTEFASILEQSLDDDADVDFYLKTPTDGSVFEIWQDEDRTINQNISFYGGYQSDWQRDSESNQTPVTTTQNLGLLYSQTDDYVEVSGLSISLTLDDISNSSINRIAAIYGLSATELMVRNNTISIADYPFDSSSAALYGVCSDNVMSFSLVSNSITTGAAPISARDEAKNINSGDNGNPGSGGDGDDGGSGGSGQGGRNGGAGGAGGNGFNEDGDDGGLGSIRGFVAAGGGDGGDASSDDNDGSGGSNGLVGLTATIGEGANGYGRFTSGGRFAFTTGETGGEGGDGTGGGGGGGGASSLTGFNGGGGGGGGEGGEGGAGGFGADSGGASIGVYLVGGTVNDISNNVIVAGNGGMGGIGGLGADGGNGGSGGGGATGNSNNSGNGGDGGDGGDGADGGIGGSGGGGPSFGILINPDTFATISNNDITTGDGGEGGAAVIATVSSAAGKGGWSIGIFDADTEDGITPEVSENIFTIGEAGSDGNPSEDAGTAAETNF